MKDLLTDIYNKVLHFFQSSSNTNGSKTLAKNRLKLVLMQDRMNLDSSSLESLREDIIKTISKYMEIDINALDLNLSSEGDSFALMLNIPVIRTKTLNEISCNSVEKNTNSCEKEDNICSNESKQDIPNNNLETIENVDDNTEKIPSALNLKIKSSVRTAYKNKNKKKRSNKNKIK